MTVYEDLPKWDGDRSTPETPHWNFNHLPCRVNFMGPHRPSMAGTSPFSIYVPGINLHLDRGFSQAHPKKSSAGSPGPGRVRKPRAAMIEEGDLEIDGIDGING